MRGIRSFVILLVILIGLGGYLYFVESGRTPGDNDEQHDKVFTVEADAIEEITVRSESGDRTTLRKTGTEWQIAEPAGAAPDPGEVSSLTSNLASLEIQRVLDEEAADLKEFGLEPPRFDVAFKAGGQEHKLLLGAKTPPGSDLYARLDNQKRVFLVPSHIEATFNQTTFDLRDKRIIALDRDAIDRVEISSAGRTMVLTKTGSEWSMAEPIAAPADFSAVSGLIGRLTSAQMQSLAADGAAAGLDSPAATVTVGAGASRTALRIGAAAGEDARYARAESRPEIFTVESSLVDELTKPPADYRQKDLFDARAFNATRLELTRDGQTVVFEKAKAAGTEEQKWRRVVPSPGDVDGATVDAFIAAATAAQAQSFVDEAAKAALSKPALVVAIKYDEGKKEDRVTFARAGAGAFAARAGMAGAAAIDPASLESILKSAAAIR